MSNKNIKLSLRLKRKKRIKKKIFGTFEKPRLSVFRSSKHIYAQLIDDVKKETLVSASSLEKEFDNKVIKEDGVSNKIGNAFTVGKLIGERASEKGYKKIVFDRNGFVYHGRIKAVSEGARKAGLIF